MNPVQKAAQDWEAGAIEKCRHDPAVAAAGLCYVCMDSHPCFCERAAAVRRMREYYEANRRIEPSGWGPFRKPGREEPKDTGSWGVQFDALMRGLYKIAIGER